MIKVIIALIIFAVSQQIVIEKYSDLADRDDKKFTKHMKKVHGIVFKKNGVIK